MAKNPVRSITKSYVFRKHSNIGAADAIDDKKYLFDCFIDNGELAIITDFDSPNCIITGRTGSGKTALLEQLDYTEDKVIKIPPDGLALTYVSDNGVLNFFSAAGVNMDLFYRLLWRHVFAVEIIREHYHIINEKARDNFLVQIRDRLQGNKSRQDALEYFTKWGNKFWLDCELQVKEVTKKLVENLGATIDGSIGGVIPGITSARIELGAELAKNLTQEQKAEVVRRGQRVVDSVQMKALSDLMDILEKDILDDDQKKYFITIDRLDENWINDDLRYHLIRALLDTVREFNNKIRNVKIIVAIREDLLDRVFRYTRSPGYQEEKYKSMYLPITWSEEELVELVNRRVTHLIREQYTTQPVQLKDLLPSLINKDDPVRFMLSRTMLRPRDIIMFFNECITQAEGRAKFTQTMVYQAESIYSENRLRALADEWSSDFQNLVELVLFLKKFPSQFRPCDFKDKIQDAIIDFLGNNFKNDVISKLIQDTYENGDIENFMQEMFKILFRVGVVGIKPETYSMPCWSYQGQKLVSSEIKLNALFFVHPAFWRVLGIAPNNRS
jgi:hypothetical protein